MTLSITEQIEIEYFLLSGHEGELPSRQARAIIKVIAEHIERQDENIKILKERILELKNTDHFVKNYFFADKKNQIVIDSVKANG